MYTRQNLRGILKFYYQGEANPDNITGAIDILTNNGISIEQLECFIVLQDQPWKDVELLFRPHPWAHNEAPDRHPSIDRYNSYVDENYTIKYAMIPVGQDMPAITAAAISTHKSDQGMIYSPNNMACNLQNQFASTHNLYSLCVDATKNKAALTYHCLLNDADQNYVDRALRELVLTTTEADLTVNKFIGTVNTFVMGDGYDSGINFSEILKFAKITNDSINELNPTVTESSKAVVTPSVTMPPIIGEINKTVKHSLNNQKSEKIDTTSSTSSAIIIQKPVQ